MARWSNQEIGFHQAEVDPWLRKLWPELGLPPGSGVFVPLCGKSLDVAWLAQQGHSVIGVELAEPAVRALLDEAGLPAHAQRLLHLLRFESGPITLYCGDYIDLNVLHLPGVAAVYDRAALIALPPRMRAVYVDHLLRIIPDGCQILLLTLEYDQSALDGPPHAVLEPEIQQLFGARCGIERRCSAPARLLPAKFAAAGVEDATEAVYHLIKRS